jgi:hypothetical protein
MQRYLIALLHVSLIAAPLFVDDKTALMWQDTAENKGTLYNWNDAKSYCEALTLSNYDDWWLPSESELSSIIDTSRPRGRMIKKGFIYYKARPYWTSTTYAWNAPYAWVLSFENGTSYSQEKQTPLHVRCVRCSDFKKCLERFYNHL